MFFFFIIIIVFPLHSSNFSLLLLKLKKKKKELKFHWTSASFILRYSNETFYVNVADHNCKHCDKVSKRFLLENNLFFPNIN